MKITVETNDGVKKCVVVEEERKKFRNFLKAHRKSVWISIIVLIVVQLPIAYLQSVAHHDYLYLIFATYSVAIDIVIVLLAILYHMVKSLKD